MYDLKKALEIGQNWKIQLVSNLYRCRQQLRGSDGLSRLAGPPCDTILLFLFLSHRRRSSVGAFPVFFVELSGPEGANLQSIFPGENLSFL